MIPLIPLKESLYKLPAPIRKIIATKWTWISLGALPSLRFYYVQEMVAALMIFSVLFAAVALVALVIFLLDRASLEIVTWAEAGLGSIVHWVSGAAEALFARPVWVQALPHRFRKELKHTGKT